MTMQLTYRRQILMVMVAPLFALMPAKYAQAQPSDEAIWNQYMQWLPTAPPAGGGAGSTRNQYRLHLIASGASPAEADRQSSAIQRMMSERPDGWRAVFNNVYSNPTPGFATEPNALLIATVESRKPGRALDIGMGQGRNAVFLAIKGWDVTGFDISDEGIAVARKNAERAGVKLNAIRETDEAFDYGSEQWDVIVFMYEPFPLDSAAYVERLRKSMKPGGLIVIESFGPRPGRTAQIEIDPDKLLPAFKDFRVLRFEDTMAIPDWGNREKTRVVRLVAEKRR